MLPLKISLFLRGYLSEFINEDLVFANPTRYAVHVVEIGPWGV